MKPGKQWKENKSRSLVSKSRGVTRDTNRTAVRAKKARSRAAIRPATTVTKLATKTVTTRRGLQSISMRSFLAKAQEKANSVSPSTSTTFMKKTVLRRFTSHATSSVVSLTHPQFSTHLSPFLYGPLEMRRFSSPITKPTPSSHDCSVVLASEAATFGSKPTSRPRVNTYTSPP
jgi:hypothetical protein